MAFLTPSPIELMMIAVIALIVLGPSRLPEAARSLGKGMREMRNSFQFGGDDDDDDGDKLASRLVPDDEPEDDDGDEPDVDRDRAKADGDPKVDVDDASTRVLKAEGEDATAELEDDRDRDKVAPASHDGQRRDSVGAVEQRS